MKKILISIFAFLVMLPCCAIGKNYSDINKVQVSKSEQKIIQKDNRLLELLNRRNNYRQKGDLVNSIKILEELYHADKNYLGQENEQAVNLRLLEYLTMDTWDKYELSKDNKYLDKSYKYSKLAVENKTNFTPIVESSIYVSYLKLREKNMMKSFEYLCNLDQSKCQEYKENVHKAYDEIKQVKQQRQAGKMAALSLFFTAFGQGVSSSQPTRTNCSVYNNMFGDSMYCTSY